ncbi:DUF1249 domain-containing protein [Halomonas nitroreducens]|uniref:DUF1249 domain-containing protein n=1 Tax=Halomonas nitroreducens TaxID=447425 RepID=A0A3S0I6A4_9GAMM|nr:DUF1249 domain-containing protein [Halomonas nitroreducens]RTR00761.1 DUF1249 domain-containing protein [Halomonas nitroreducens]
MSRSAYVTDLRTLQGECTANYLRLTRLLGDLEAGESREVELVNQGRRLGALCLKVQERAPYTSIIRVSQRGVLDAVIDAPRMRVHLYHDVRMAEVTDFQRQRHFDGRYRYPNARMHQPDEKLQLNRFLGEWLDHGLAHGHSLDLPELP